MAISSIKTVSKSFFSLFFANKYAESKAKSIKSKDAIGEDALWAFWAWYYEKKVGLDNESNRGKLNATRAWILKSKRRDKGKYIK